MGRQTLRSPLVLGTEAWRIIPANLVFQEGIGKVGPVDHEVRPFHVQGGFALGDGGQNPVPWYLCVISILSTDTKINA